ncbi:MAG: hypothetical protein HC925_00790, partial [Coleofasciculaceae cyanobacterium SM2_3_26]|nr:hypothetical protein [Coleofasciculaceae cyanobacterium SM2_3_26]
MRRFMFRICSRQLNSLVQQRQAIAMLLVAIATLWLWFAPSALAGYQRRSL